MPAFRLSASKKDAFLTWISEDVKFTDGHASNLRNCIDFGEGKFVGMKSHDCHVVMQRLLPFAFVYLLPKDIHQAIGGVGAFFRDLCSRTLSAAAIHTLQQNIPVILCNLEKIFPPSFFDVMEHLTIHLPREAALGGPVQYRWMYPFERYMLQLKKKVKNLSRVEGSIVAQCLNEEVSTFSEYYFPSHVRTKRRRPARHDDRGERAIYPVFVPPIFEQVGRLIGKGKRRRLSELESSHLHAYILSNCDQIREYESIYDGVVRSFYPYMTEDELLVKKTEEFSSWLKFYVTERTEAGDALPTWLVDLCNGLTPVAFSYPSFCTRGYAFRVRSGGNQNTTADHGISAQSGEITYYGILNEVLEVHYPGLLDLRCTVFMCDWYDPIIGHGVRIDQLGVVSVHSRRRLRKYDPFILASQADQVCYLTYPRVTVRVEPWVTVTPIHPRGRIYGVSEHDAMQAVTNLHMNPVPIQDEVDLVVDFTQNGDDDIIYSGSEGSRGEYDDDTDSLPSEESDDSD